jgi:transposase
LKAQIGRELDRIELLLAQIEAVEQSRDAVLAAAPPKAATAANNTEQAREAVSFQTSIPGMLLELKGIGPETASVLWLEGLYRNLDNRRQVAAYAGLAASPWQSGKIDHDQGVSKAGNPRLRTTLCGFRGDRAHGSDLMAPAIPI